MLIVGDLPYKLSVDKNFPVEAVEVIVAPENINRVFTELKIKDERGISLGQGILMYMQKGQKYIIYPATNVYLKMLLKENFAINTLRIATPALNYVYLWYQNNLRRHDPIKWVKVIKQSKNLVDSFYYTYRDKKKQYKLLKIGERICTRTLVNMNQFKKPYERNGFIKYSKYDLLVAIGSAFQSPYKRVVNTPGPLEFFNKAIWSTLSAHEQKICVLEAIYLFIISETFVSEKFISNTYPEKMKWQYLFIEAIMDMVTAQNPANTYIQQYMFDNLDDLIKSYREDVIQKFIDAERKKEITTIKEWTLDET